MSNAENDPKSLYSSGYEWYEKEEYDLAIRDFSSVISLGSNLHNAYLMRAISLYLKGEVENACDDLSEAISIEPENVDTRFLRAVYSQSIHPKKALQDCKMCLEMNSQYIRVYGHMGDIYSEMGDFDLAIESYSKAISFEPEDAHHYNGRYKAYVEKKEIEKSIQDIDKLLEIVPQSDYGYWWSRRAYGNEDIGKKDEAISDISKSIQLESELPEKGLRYLFRGVLWMEKAEKEKAKHDFLCAFKLNPSRQILRALEDF